MTVTIDTAKINRYRDTLHDQVEQKSSALRPTVTVESATGDKHFFDRLGSFTAQARSGRLEQRELDDAPHSRRMATIQIYDAETYLDKIDKLAMLADPTSEYVKKLARALGRSMDDVIYTAMTGAAATGQTGSGSQAFDTTNNQIDHGSAGLTVAKVNQAVRILESNEVDTDMPLFMAMKALGFEDLLGQDHYINVDYQDNKALTGRKYPTFRGINLVRCERITDETAGTTRRALLYTPTTIKVALAQDVQLDVAERKDLKGNPIQVAADVALGAVRMEEETIVDILYQ